MKIREGFVSNSSSSSFICMVSGRIEAGYDLSMRDVEMYQCENGHYFDDSYLLPAPPKIDIDEDEDGDERYECPAARCPICTLDHITDVDLLKYILKSRAFNKEGLKATMREQYKDHETFTEAMKA